jgi:glycosyltransferase involved in cell wall biosynthesis
MGGNSLSNNRIKVAICANSLHINGISAVIMNYCRNIDLSKFEINILVGAPIEETYRDQCRKLGITVIELPERKKSPIQFYSALRKELYKNKFDIFHVHGNSATITIELMIAYLNGIRVRIAHGHSSTCNHIKIHRVLHPIFDRLYTAGFACSTLSAHWMYGDKEFTVIPDGLETEKYRYSENDRRQVRKRLGLENAFVICHVGRFNSAKNHPYLIDIFENVASEKENAILLLVGDGPDFKLIKNLAKNSKHSDRIIFYGESKEVGTILSASDIFIYPSKAEGFGIAVLEAQISGLPCIVSDQLPKDVILGEGITFLPIDETDVETWKNEILSVDIGTERRFDFYEKNSERIMQYDINMNVKKLEKQYEELYRLKYIKNL